MKVTYRNKFDTKTKLFGQEQISVNLFTWLENIFLIGLTLSFLVGRYLSFLNTNSSTTTFLRFYTIAFIGLQSFLKANQLFNDVTKKTPIDLYTKKNMYRFVAFAGAFTVAILGILSFNKTQVGISEMLTAVGMSVFPFQLTELFDVTSTYVDLLMNGIYALLLVSGLVCLYFGKNLMGLFCTIALGTRGVYGLVRGKMEKNEGVLSREYMMTIGLAALSCLIMIGCYLKGINLNLPALNELFGRAVETV